VSDAAAAMAAAGGLVAVAAAAGAAGVWVYAGVGGGQTVGLEDRVHSHCEAGDSLEVQTP
jgi:hypothetical protein